ncbi:SH3-domain-containing protein, partial [Zopfia rhizophila CBS 207.26]
DTLDLQDKTSPTAQDHSRQPQHPAPLGIGPAAPHQEASLRQVDNERSTEESGLRSSTWSDATTLRDDPGSDDERTVVNGVHADSHLQQDEQAVRLNGGMTGGRDDGEMADADVEEDMDDDMMDKISSSPSIDDGGYPLPCSIWPKQSSSRTLNSTPTTSPFSSPSTKIDSSSPFTATPLHLPLSSTAARGPISVLAAGPETTSRCPYRPSSPPFFIQPPFQEHKMQSEEHHHGGEYRSPKEAATPTADFDLVYLSTDHARSHLLSVVEARLQNIRQGSQMSLLSEFDEADLQSRLQPVHSPLRNAFDDSPDPTNENDRLPPLTDEDDDSWATDSDADSWDEEFGDDDDSNDVSFSDDPRFVDSGWGGECLREIEDIDFEFVYALHTFVATVEGQANATKGDTMVLLDDSNSYWWLVRVVKDSSIGYLPAEHIETPTERLARLNKHRNIDLSATMLGDTAEKTKNPLKKAMRRRNAKTVQFAAPTYVEASDYDYSSDDDNGDEELFGGADPNQAQAESANEKSEPEQDDGLKVQPLKVNGANKDATSSTSENETSRDSNDETTKSNGDKPRTSDEVFERPLDPKVSRNGTLRNTDSFFKDENTETRKITLTPNLLRDDSSTSTTGSRERGPSLESLEKNGFADKVKEDKKKKEKK